MYLLRRSWGISEAHSIEKTRMNSRAKRLRVSEELCAGAHFGHIAIATGEIEPYWTFALERVDFRGNSGREKQTFTPPREQ